MYEVALHLEYYSRPALQRHIIRILLMPPIYALDSWFCLRFINARTYLTPIRECYEAYTIYNFFMYLLRYLDGAHPLLSLRTLLFTGARWRLPVHHLQGSWAQSQTTWPKTVPQCRTSSRCSTSATNGPAKSCTGTAGTVRLFSRLLMDLFTTAFKQEFRFVLFF